MPRQVYEACPLCDGTGRLRRTMLRSGQDPLLAGDLCPGGCKRLHVVETGLTVGQVERMAKRELAEQMALASGSAGATGEILTVWGPV